MSRAFAFQFLCGCLARNLPEARLQELRQIALSDRFAWKTFVELTGSALVAPAVLASARRNGIAEVLPVDVVAFLDGMTTLNRQRNAGIRTQSLELAAMLNGQGVVPVLLKGGAHLLSGLYTDPAHRIMVDLDLLVAESRLADCVAVMNKDGYQVIFDNGYPASHHYPALCRPGTTVAVELHVRPLGDPYGYLLTADEIFATTSEIRFGLAKFSMPSAQARVIHVIVHTQLTDHDYLYGRFSLRELLDYARLCEHYGSAIDWADISRRFRAHRAATALGYQALAAQALLGAPIAPEIRTGLLARILFRISVWQVAHPAVLNFRIRILRPLLLLHRALSSALLRRKLLRDLRDRNWLRRQWRMLCWPNTHQP